MGFITSTRMEVFYLVYCRKYKKFYFMPLQGVKGMITMIEIYKSYDTDLFPVKIDSFEKGCWINIVSPTEQELNFVETSLNVSSNF